MPNKSRGKWLIGMEMAPLALALMIASSKASVSRIYTCPVVDFKDFIEKPFMTLTGSRVSVEIKGGADGVPCCVLRILRTR